VIERAVVLSQNQILDEKDFSEISEKLEAQEIGVRSKRTEEVAMVPEQLNLSNMINLENLDGRALDVVIGEVESRLIQYALKKFRYTKTRVAKYLGINRNTLDKRIRELKIEY
jgi:Nif-specific regulatory protein